VSDLSDYDRFLLGQPDCRVRIVNSWGERWGQGGEAWLSFADLERLIHEEGEACGPVEKRLIKKPPQAVADPRALA